MLELENLGKLKVILIIIDSMIIMSLCLLSEISSSVRIALTKQVPRPCTIFLPSSNLFCFHVVTDEGVLTLSCPHMMKEF